MAQSTQFTIGAEARCRDGVCGSVTHVVIDPVVRAVTHLVVEPKHRTGLGRLVPVDLVEVTDDGVDLGCTMAEFGQLEHAEETHFLPGIGGGYGGYGPDQTLAWPYFGLGSTILGGGAGLGTGSLPVITDTLPLGEVAVHRGDPVHADDGDIGRVQGLVIDASTRHVTHVLLQEGHLWGRKEVAIPISSVSGIHVDGIWLRLTKDEVAALPPVDLAHPAG